MVAAGDFDPESERDIYFASEHCKADPGPPIVPVDFIPELWVTCLETMPKAKRTRFLLATAAGDRIRKPTEDLQFILEMAAKDLAEKIHDCADEAITYERICNPPAPFELNANRKERTIKALLPTQGVFWGTSAGITAGAAIGVVGGPIGAVSGSIIGGIVGSFVGYYGIRKRDEDDETEEK